MKILVIDDTRTHLKAAIQTLSEHHEVTTCSSYDEALKLFSSGWDEEEKERLIKEYESAGMKRGEARGKAQKETFWDVVLCDLLMPAGRDAQGDKGRMFVGEEMPVGWSLALVAVEKGAKYVAVVTDMNHHNHPASAMLDRLDGHIFTIDGAKMLLTNHVREVGISGSECECEECGGKGKKTDRDGSEYSCYHCKDGIDFSEKGKNWGKILDKFLETE